MNCALRAKKKTFACRVSTLHNTIVSFNKKIQALCILPALLFPTTHDYQPEIDVENMEFLAMARTLWARFEWSTKIFHNTIQDAKSPSMAAIRLHWCAPTVSEKMTGMQKPTICLETFWPCECKQQILNLV